MGKKGRGGRGRESEPKAAVRDEKRNGRTFFLVAGLVVVLGAFFFWPAKPAPATHTPRPGTEGRQEAPVFSYRVVEKFPHDPKAFTQGLIVDPRNPNYFFEGTGMYGDSELRRVDIKTGKPTHSLPLPPSDFGEGIVMFKNFIFQLTWREFKIYRYQLQEQQEGGEEAVFVERNPDIFSSPPEFREGWGLTHDKTHLIVSDGTYKLFFVNPDSLKVERTLIVRDGKKRVTYLNELEFIEGEIWANVWFTTKIYVISPTTGFVLRKIDLEGLKTSGDVYNGIAYYKDPQSSASHLYVTGKYWPNLYEIEVV